MRSPSGPCSAPGRPLFTSRTCWSWLATPARCTRWSRCGLSSSPAIPVIGTVPAIKPAAAAYQNVAIWATVATTSSAYQRKLIAEFGGSAQVTAVACPGLADAIDAGDQTATAAAIAAAAGKTPKGCEAIVLGCTEYELAAGKISRAVPGVVTFGSAGAVAAQALRRIPANALQTHGDLPASPLPTSPLPAPGRVRVLLSARPADLPPAARRYPEGRLLGPLVVLADDGEPMAESAASLQTR